MRVNSFVRAIHTIGTKIKYGTLGRVVPFDTYPEKAAQLLAIVGSEYRRFICVDWVQGPAEDGFYISDRFEQVTTCQS